MNAKGFTLIEIIAVMLIIGMLSGVAGLGIATGARSLMDARESSMLAQEAQLAMDRLTREIMELVDIPANSTSSLLVLRNINTSRSIQYVAASQDVRIADGTTGAAAGDVLINNVTAFSYTYWQGTTSSTSWASTNDPRRLSAIDISLTLSAPGGTTRVFTSRVGIRNNDNRGGAAPTVVPPSLARYDICFVATAASGNTDHPMVVQLRQFRDRYLLTWEGGRKFVSAYYTVGPNLAAIIESNEGLRKITFSLLLPAATIIGLAMNAPGYLVACILLSILLVATVSHLIRRNNQQRSSSSGLPHTSQRGAVLISVIATILAFSVFAATLTPMMTATTQGEFFASQGDQSYYLAESGFTSAGSIFLNAGDDQARKQSLATMNGSTYTLANNAGSFSLIIEPYWFELTNGATAGATTLQTTAYGTPPPATTFSNGGRLRIGDSSTFYTYTGATITGNTVRFNGISPALQAGVANRTDVFLSTQANTQTVTERGNLVLNSTASASFPAVNGMFTIRQGTTHTGRVAYVYRRKTGNTLEDVRLLDGQGITWSNIVLNGTGNNAANITLEAFIRLHSTGRTAGGNTREVVYNIPIGWVLGGGSFSKEQYQDTFDNLNAWFTGGSDQGQLGGHAFPSGALDITAMQTAATSGFGAFLSWLTGSNQWSSLFFNWSATNINLAKAWSDAKGNSSYDLQFKANIPTSSQTSEPQFFGGILFRARNNGASDLDAFGLSFVRFRESRYYVLFLGWTEWALANDVPQELVPEYVNASNRGSLFVSPDETKATGLFSTTEHRYSRPAIMLWERRNGVFRWLAYKRLGQSSGIISYSSSGSKPTYRLSGWPTLLVRLVEGQELQFQNGGGSDGAGGTLRINYGDEIMSTTGASARVIGQPIVTSGDWASSNAAGKFIVTNVETDGTHTFNSGQDILVKNIRHARTVSGTLGAKTNYIRVYFSDSGSNTSGDATPYNPTSPESNSSYSTASRQSNQRISATDQKIKWIPDDYEQWVAATDFFTLIEWDAYNSSVSAGISNEAERLNSTNFSRTILKTQNLLSPSYNEASPVYDPAESLGISTSGPSGDSFLFDDFGLQLDIRGGKGFLPPIQQ